MKFMASVRSICIAFVAAIAAGCGGGGGSGNDSGFNPPGINVSVTATASQAQAGQSVAITVRVTEANGAPIRDLTAVRAVVTPSSAGTVVGAGTFLGVAQSLTAGGVATFTFTGLSPGQATVTVSVTDPFINSRSATASLVINVTAALDTAIRITVTPTSLVVPTQGLTDIAVRVLRANGQPVANGTTVLGTTVPATAGRVFGLPTGTTNTATTVGGVASFRFQAGVSPASVETLFSVTDVERGGEVVNGSARITVAGVDLNRLRIDATRTRLPINSFFVPFFFGSPYVSEVTITLRAASGQPVNMPDGVQVAINPVTIGAFSTLDDPATEDINEILVLLGSGPVDVTAGKATVFVQSFDVPGRVTLTVSGQDPETSQTLVATQDFDVVSTTSNLPNSVFVSPTRSPQYVQGSGGPTSGQFAVVVFDGTSNPVPDPVSGNNAFNNVRLELIGGDASGGARISGISANGQTAIGSPINVRTTAGSTGGSLLSGARVGNIVIRATSDRADNNVDNGISDPVFAQRTVAVSDGVLFDIEITQPTRRALTINPVEPGVTVDPDGVPPNANGTYSLTVGAIATDRLGNPVLPNTTISFGLIDEPQFSGIGDFFLAGGDGDPLEAGTVFTALSGAFTTRGGGAGPGDALILFGEEIIGNRDHESARVIRTVDSPSSLTTSRRFNTNDDTGNLVDSGAILPYVVGRAADGNIVASGTTNALGVVVTKMNYPQSRLGKVAIIWAQGEGDVQGGSPETVTDAEFVSFAGVAPATIFASPSPIPGNSTVSMRVCVIDRIGSRIQGVAVGFQFSGLAGGVGTASGISTSGTLPTLTGRNGCVDTVVTTAGITTAGVTLTFSGAGDTDVVPIQIGALVLSARPDFFFGGGGDTTLRLTDGGGRPIVGVQLSGACVGTGGAIVGTQPAPGSSGVTDSNGETVFSINTANLNQVDGMGEGVCTYRTPSGTPSVIVNLLGFDVCDTAFSPPPQGCDTTAATQFDLVMILRGGTTTSNPNGNINAVAVDSSPSGVSCSRPESARLPTPAAGTAYADIVCTSAKFDRDTTVALRATTSLNGVINNTAVSFAQDCFPLTTANSAVSVMAGNRTCVVIVP